MVPTPGCHCILQVKLSNRKEFPWGFLQSAVACGPTADVDWPAITTSSVRGKLTEKLTENFLASIFFFLENCGFEL